MIPEKLRKFSTVNLRVLEQEEGKDLDGGNVFGQILRRGKLRIGGKCLGIGKNG